MLETLQKLPLQGPFHQLLKDNKFAGNPPKVGLDWFTIPVP